MRKFWYYIKRWWNNTIWQTGVKPPPYVEVFGVTMTAEQIKQTYVIISTNRHAEPELIQFWREILTKTLK